MRTETCKSFESLLELQNHATEVEALCRRIGPAAVIDIARGYIRRKEEAARKEHDRWKAEMIAMDRDEQRKVTPAQPDRSEES